MGIVPRACMFSYFVLCADEALVVVSVPFLQSSSLPASPFPFPFVVSCRDLRVEFREWEWRMLRGVLTLLVVLLLLLLFTWDCVVVCRNREECGLLERFSGDAPNRAPDVDRERRGVEFRLGGMRLREFSDCIADLHSRLPSGDGFELRGLFLCDFSSALGLSREFKHSAFSPNQTVS